MQALGYIAPGVKRRAVSDKSNYWRLTERGNVQLIASQAIRTSKKDSVVPEHLSDILG